MACDVFLSYTRVKDFRGTVADFCVHLQRELQKKTGRDDLRIFLDTTYIPPGAIWSKTLEAELASARMLMILLSPTWIRSEWCRREYQVFLQQSHDTGVERLVVPVLWDEVSAADCKTSEQRELLAEIQAHQTVKWGELQYETWASESLRKAISRLAVKLKPALV